MFPVFRVDRKCAIAPEQLGSKSKFWFQDGTRHMLFKAEERGTGEDWAEKITECLCGLLGVPHVNYQLAELYDGERFVQPGVVCESCAPTPMALVLGNQLLLAFDESYPAQHNRKYKVREHTIQAVVEVVRALLLPPPNWLAETPPGIEGALDVFAGYLLLDAWTANQDRPHENWGAVWDGTDMRLAPTFDHGAGLARNLKDAEREERLRTKDRSRTIPFFAGRARSAFYKHELDTKPLPTVEAFVEFQTSAQKAAQIWLGRLAKIDRAAVQQILEEVPENRMSPFPRSSR